MIYSIDTYPEWSRAIERRRRDLCVRQDAIDKAAKMYKGFWNRNAMRSEPPAKWKHGRAAERVKRFLDKLEGR